MHALHNQKVFLFSAVYGTMSLDIMRKAHIKRKDSPMLLIINAYLINPATEEEGYYDILVKENRICRIRIGLYQELKTAQEDALVEPLKVLDASGMIAAPGLVDVHSHFRDHP